MASPRLTEEIERKSTKIKSTLFTTIPSEVKFEHVERDGSLTASEKENCLQIKLRGNDAWIYSAQFDEGSYGVINLINQGTQWYVGKIISDDGYGTADEVASEYRFASQVGLAKETMTFESGCSLYHLIVMEWIPGMNLSKYLASNSLMSAHQRYKLTLSTFKCAEALFPIIHRDFNTGNLVMRTPYEVTAIDYGLSVPAPAEGSKIKWECIGTPFFMAPELIKDSKEVCGINIDKFAFGMTLSDLYGFSNPAFASYNNFRVLSACMTEPRVLPKTHPHIKEAAPNIPETAKSKLYDYVQKHTHEDPTKRPKFSSEEKKSDPKEPSESETMLMSALEEIKKTSIVKGIVDIAELKDLIISAEQKDLSLSRQKSTRAALNEFRHALLTTSAARLIEAKDQQHDIIDRSLVSRFLSASYTKGDLRTEIGLPAIVPGDNLNEKETALVVIEPEFFSSEDESDIVKVAAAVPDKEKEMKDDWNCYYIFVTNKKYDQTFLAEKQIIILSPSEIMKIAQEKCLEPKDLKLSTLKNTFFSRISTSFGMTMHAPEEKRARLF